ncbi:MAG TPA: isoaspartyl peptidase/L-asparaginase family protein [Ktedonobacterales bacterium]|nr:isoaspartyl peptidase/L-asparaginase family protein [Ktedonobacterales bacterium]
MGRAIIVHGGAGLIPPDRYETAREGCRAAAEAGWRVLAAGGSALDAVEAAITSLEDNPGFNAGTGGVLTSDGRVQLDCGMMEGASLNVGAVAGVERIKNPIQVARAVLASPHVLLVGAGAEEFARESGFTLCDPSDLITPYQYARWQRGYRPGDGAHAGAELDAVLTEPSATNGHTPDAVPVHADDTKHGTVGAVAVDDAGNIVASASTGGRAGKHLGRVGDTPLPGCGYYAENGIGGISCTGDGEDFIRLLLAKRVADYVAAGLPAQGAASAAIRLLGERTTGEGGLIVLDSQGRVGYARNSATMAHAFMVEGMSAPFAGV